MSSEMREHLQQLQRLHAQGRLTELPLHFARFLLERAEHPCAELALATALVSQATSEGHVCLDLTRVAARALWLQGESCAESAPELESWLLALRQSGVVGEPGDYQPLILDGANRLYLHRYWHYEQSLARGLLQRAGQLMPDVDRARLATDLAHLFPASAESATDWQKLAAATAMLRGLSVISGGPGTGKTTTVTRLLALLRLQPGGESLRIALAAPTGKAAARMQEAVQQAKSSLDLPVDLVAQIPEQASTLHRLLGYVPGETGFRHHADNPLAVDVLILDEASMVDLALMEKLLRALPVECRLILLGDKDQLASVEAGALLGDICSGCQGPSSAFASMLESVSGESLADAKGAGDGICDSVVMLQRGFRFSGDSPIGRLASAVNQGDAQTGVRLLRESEGADQLGWLSQETRLDDYVAGRYAEVLQRVQSGQGLQACFDDLNRFRLLCAVRRGPAGSVAMNAAISASLQRLGFIPPAGEWYPGRPVMITHNDYQAGLYNGDLGIALPDPQRQGMLGVAFPGEGDAARWFSPARLPPHETVYAMTVHKSQGSEFDQVALLLPDRDLPLLTRELVYTAVTRARREFLLCAPEAVFRQTLQRRMRRHSGLADLLRPGSSFLTT